MLLRIVTFKELERLSLCELKTRKLTLFLFSYNCSVWILVFYSIMTRSSTVSPLPLSIIFIFDSRYLFSILQHVKDPINDSKDTENENGNIYNAILTFPVMHTFHVIGKTNQNDAIIQQFQKDIHDIIYTTVSSSSRVTANNEIVVSVTPRGSKYTKITVQANVENASMISSIYEQLQLLELSIMQF